jgi:hypothetical protein
MTHNTFNRYTPVHLYQLACMCVLLAYADVWSWKAYAFSTLVIELFQSIDGGIWIQIIL